MTTMCSSTVSLDYSRERSWGEDWTVESPIRDKRLSALRREWPTSSTGPVPGVVRVSDIVFRIVVS
jgi:hypothetical protein